MTIEFTIEQSVWPDNAELIKQVREGQVLRRFAQYEELSLLIDYLSSECCINE